MQYKWKHIVSLLRCLLYIVILHSVFSNFLYAATEVVTVGISASITGVNMATFRSAPMSTSLSSPENSTPTEEPMSKGVLDVTSAESNTEFNVILLEDDSLNDDTIDTSLSSDSQLYQSDENGKTQVELNGEASVSGETPPGDYQESYIVVVAY